MATRVAAGSIIDLSVAQNTTKEKEEHDKFIALQNDIRDLFAIHPPSTPELTVRNMTQTSLVLEWNLLDLSTAEMKSLTLYKNGTKLGKIPNATTTTTKLSGLALDTEYTFQLVLRSTAGIFKSKELKVRTHKMTNLTGLNVCLSNLKPEEREKITSVLARIGAKPPHDKIRIDTTHFVTNRGVGDEYKKAQNMNIPVVIPEFVEACEAEGRLMRAGSYYLDSDPALRSKRTAPVAAPVPASTPAPDQMSQSTTNQASATPAIESTSSSTAADSIMPAQTTPLSDENQEAVSEPGVLENMAAKVGSVKETAQAGLEQVKSTITESLQPGEAQIEAPRGSDKQEDNIISPAAAAPTETKEQAATKEAVEPHEEAAKSVIDLPAQVGDTSIEAAAHETDVVNRDANEEMEEVAL